MSELVFCKLGGSVITDKGRPETARHDVIARLAGEVAHALAARPGLRLVLGHGSGSFGHTVAHRYGTRHGVQDAAAWRGFAQVAAVAARLDRIVMDHLLAAGVPAWSMPPSASAACRAGRLVALATQPVEVALSQALVPVVYGDVAVDELLGGTIVSTEQVLAFLARRFGPRRMILLSDVDGVFGADPSLDPAAQPLAEISTESWPRVRASLTGARTTDVTGGMLSKIEEMIVLTRDVPGLVVHVVSGERPGVLEAMLVDPGWPAGGTRVHAGSSA